ncbi:MAG: RNA polymerase sigma factor [Planctomycetes bacterium]|nr:RNA polymerase sigma factor [Planctomycetota bacterium]
MLSDADLVKRVLMGDRSAYGELFERYERSVLAVGLSVLGDLHAAQDVSQETFVMAYEKLPALRRGSSFGVWVQRIARNEAIGYVRRLQRRQSAEESSHRQKTRSDNHRLDAVGEKLLKDVLRLPRHERSVVMLHYFEAHPVKAVSAMTGRPVGTVTMQLSRARARLLKWLKESAL